MPWLTDFMAEHDLRLLGAAAVVSAVGTWLAVVILPRAASPIRHQAVLRVAVAGLLVASTAWVTFAVSLAGYFPRLDANFPATVVLRSLPMSGLGSVFALSLAVFGARRVRNVVLAGSILSAAPSCVLFASMAVLVQPLALAYDLSGVIATMAGSSALYAFGLWRFAAPDAGSPRVIPAALMAAATLVVVLASLGSILPFSDWAMATEMPGTFAFQPEVVVFLAELAVAAMLALAGAGIDRQSATRVEHENERLRQLSESTFEALVIHRAGVVLDANSTFCALIGRPLSAIKGTDVMALVPDGEPPAAPLVGAGTLAPREIELVTADGSRLPAEIQSRDIAYTGGVARVTALRDIRERRAAEQQIRFLAQHDVLTGLPNRSVLADLLNHHLALAQRGASPVAVFCIDLDRFKHVNDTLGHPAGDQLLKLVAARMLELIRDADTLGRIGGDEFILLQTGVRQIEGSAALAGRIIDALAEPFDVDGHQVCIGASIGIALAPQDGSLAAEVVKNADIALYRVKAVGRGRFCYFEPGMDILLRQKRETEQELRTAIAAGALVLDFQPVFDATSNTVRGFEALVRWPHPVRGVLAPADFIPLAEETGLIVPLGAWVLETACRAACAWPNSCRLAVNISPRQFTSCDLPAVVAGVLERTRLPARRLELEITETLLITDGAQALGVLQALKAMGVRIVLDDFGTGYSSLSYLQHFPFDKVKIDQSFVRGLTENADSRAIVNAIVAMSHQLHLEVTAEGVETRGQLALLRDQRCDLIQGFLLGRPMGEEDAAKLVRQRVDRPVVAATV